MTGTAVLDDSIGPAALRGARRQNGIDDERVVRRIVVDRGGSDTTALPAAALRGLALSSHTTTRVATAHFDNVAISGTN